MKKAYVKPQVYFEDFQLSASIATGCEHTTNHTLNVCSYETSVGPETKYVFVDGVSACTTVPEDGMWAGFCYHNPSENNNLFTS